MAHEKIRAALLFVAIMGLVGGISWAIANATLTHANTQEPPETMPRFDIQGYVRDQAAAYIQANHADAAQFMGNLSWTGGREETGLLGAETYVYQSQGWTVTIKYPVVPAPVYSVTFEYSSNIAPGNVGIPYHVTWQGQYGNDAIIETSYVFAQ